MPEVSKVKAIAIRVGNMVRVFDNRNYSREKKPFILGRIIKIRTTKIRERLYMNMTLDSGYMVSCELSSKREEAKKRRR